MDIRFLCAGDKNLVVELGNEISPSINQAVYQLDILVNSHITEGIIDVIPSYRSLMITFEPALLKPDYLKRQIRGLLQKMSEAELPPARLIVIPVCYDDDLGFDLHNIAEVTGLTKQAIIADHASQKYLTYCLGFTPGFPIAGSVSDKIAVPRLKNPRSKVPAGSVGIGGKQTGIYPLESPGGWQIIGRTPLQLFKLKKEGIPWLLVRARDYINFKPITREKYEEMSKEVETHQFQYENLIFPVKGGYGYN